MFFSRFVSIILSYVPTCVNLCVICIHKRVEEAEPPVAELKVTGGP